METKTVEVKITHIQAMKTRYESGFTPRQALVNLIKDESRSWGNYDNLHLSCESAIDALKYQMKTFSIENNLIIETFSKEINVYLKELTPFGKWLISVIHLHKDMTDKQYERLLGDVKKQLGF